MNELQRQLCAELWKSYEPQLQKICNIKLSGAQEDGEEVLAETFLALCKKIGLGGELEYPQAWLYATLNNLIKQKYTERAKSSSTFADLLEHTDLPYECDMAEKVFDEDMLRKLKAILEKELTEDEKQLLVYIIYEKKAYKEIAELTESSENIVKQRKFRLFNKIKKLAQKIF